MRTFLRASMSLSFLCTLGVAAQAAADATPQALPFTQDWTNGSMITTMNVWTGVPGIEGFSGAGLGTGGALGVQGVLAPAVATTINVIPNLSAVVTTGGVGEFDGIANPVVALQGSGSADNPQIVITVATTGAMGIVVAYNLRDIDGSADNSVQPIALQYRVGTSGNFINVPAGFVADASSGPTLATLVTAVSAMLPSACDNQPIVQIRIMTHDAAGSDEWIGIDDISITASPVLCGNGTLDTGEACDAGSANGMTTCGCQSNCQFGALGTTCAAAGAEPCDVADTCDGAGACAAHVRASGFVCRMAVDGCDAPETCDGTAPTCPADVLQASGFPCRLSTGTCDVTETCDGASAACPTDGFAPDATSCDDGLMCNGADACMTGVCMHAGMDCSDTNACTVDACSETATPICTHTLTAAPACCTSSAECDDSDVCTTDACTTTTPGVCTFDPVANCCHDASECAPDADPCTTDTCDTATHQCVHTGTCADAGTDAGAHDAGADGGMRDGSASDATMSGTDAGRPATRSGSCGCRAAGANGSGGTTLALIALGLAWFARKRAKRACRGCEADASGRDQLAVIRPRSASGATS